MPVSRGNQFELHSLLSDHPYLQVWRGRNLASGSDCIVKLVSDNGTPESRAVADLIVASVGRQRLIRSRRLITARQISKHDGRLAVEYPLLTGGDWRPLSPAMLVERWSELISQIAVTVDFLHLRGLVHGDLKLENFLVAPRNGSLELRLIDLDFLQTDNSNPMGVVFGTPGHIAPEVLANERILAQSDSYSLGVSLRALLDQGLGDQPELELNRPRLQSLIDELTNESYVLRPRFLTDSLVRHGLLSRSMNMRLEYELMAMLLAGQLTYKTRSALRSGQVDRFLSMELKFFGIPPELQVATKSAVAVSLGRTLRLWRAAVGDGRLTREGEFFKADFPDNLLYQLMDQLDEINGRRTAIQEQAPATELLSYVRTCRASREPLRGLRFLDQVLANGDHADRPADHVVALLLEAAECARSANRLKTEMDYWVKAYHADSSPTRFEHLAKAQIVAYRVGGKEMVPQIIAIADADPEFAKTETAILPFRRTDGWIAQVEGRFNEAESILTQVVSRAEALGMKELHVLGTYSLGITFWRRGEMATAVRRLEASLDLADRYSLPARKIPALLSLSQIFFEDGRYIESIRYGKLARRLARENDQPVLSMTALSTLLSSYARIGKPSKSAFWLQQWLVDCQHVPGQTSPAIYYAYKGFVATCQGKVEESRSALIRVLDLMRGSASTQVTQRAWMLLGELSYWASDIDQARTHLERGTEIAREINDQEALAECEAFLTMLATEPTPEEKSTLSGLALSLIHCRQTNRAAEVLLKLLLWEVPLSDELIGFVKGLREIRGYDRYALFSAVTVLTEGARAGHPVEKLDPLRWIRAYQILSAGTLYYYAMGVALKVAEHYEKEGSSKRARNYLLQAKRHAHTIGNLPMQQDIATRIESVERAAGSERSWIDSLLTVSDLMKDLGAYRQLLDRLLKFAVDQTGAERGIIFLRRSDKAGLRPVTAYNCDDQSVRELSDFSSTIPFNSLSQAVPFFIDDARRDSRTNKYQSVVAHNIMSVACIPLALDGTPVGVLYLDHHALPALFGPDDRKLMAAIANLLTVTISKARELRIISEKVGQLQSALDRHGATTSLVTQDPKLLELIRTLPRIANSSTSVLIIGESGTGKEVLCDMIHRLSPRANESFLKVNCAGIAPSLVESELFGIAKGTATNVMAREGKFEAADDGTLFLDEIGDMPPEVQAKVLRVIEYQQVERVGTTKSIGIDVRFIFATNQDLEKLVAAGKFRMDLYHRISKIVIEIPPLRERRGDIPLLIDHFVEMFSANSLPPRFTSDTLDMLVRHPWPGNVRQLRNVIESCCLYYPGDDVTPDRLPTRILRDRTSDADTAQDQLAAEKARIEAAIRSSKGNQSRAAKAVGMSLSTFRRRLKFFGLELL